jgi:hypothetical protein
VPAVRETTCAAALLILCLGWRPPDGGSAERLRAGAAAVKITPTELGWLGGYGHRNRPAEGVAAELWARALVLEEGSRVRRVLVTADIHIFTPRLHHEIAAAARSRWRIAERDLMLVATHTHSGPALPEGFDPEISWGLDEVEMRKLWAAADRIRDGVLEAIGRALSDLRPARLSVGHGEARFGVNRRVRRADGEYDFGANPAGVSDPDVPVLVVEAPDGAKRVVVFGYACHNTTIRNGREGFYRYHPDFAGAAVSEIERRLPGATALYLTGCAGDIDPQPQGGVDQAELHGRTLAAVVLGVANGSARRVLAGPTRADYREIRLPLAPAPPREKFVELAGSKSPYRQRHARRMLAQMDAGTLPREVPYPIQVWRFGKLALVALAGEVTVDYALRLKRELGPEAVWPIAYANEVPCYIPSERILAEGGYEAGWDGEHGPAVPSRTGSMTFYGWAAPLARGVEDRIVAAVHAVVRD